MRFARLLIPLAAIAPLALAPGAFARDWKVEAIDFAFIPNTSTIAAGDSVTWKFTAAGHTSTSVTGQAETWNSAPTGTNPAGTSFTHVFTKPGRYEYICIPHQDFMKGVIEVRGGSPGDPIDYARTKPRGRTVKVTFRLNEPAAVTYRLRGPSRRTIKRGQLGTGRHALTARRLKRGRYRGVLTATDASGRRTRVTRSFSIR